MNSLESFIPPHIADAIGGTIMHSLWQLAAVALLLILVLALVPQRAAKLRYWLAIAGMGLMLALPIATFGYLYEPPAPQLFGAHNVFSEPAHSPATLAWVRPSSIPAPATGIIEQANAFFQDNSYLLLGVWLLGVVVLSLRFAGSCWQVNRLRKVGTQEVPQALVERFVDLLDKVGVRRSVGLRYSALVDTPMVIGALKPMVLLPMGLLTGLSMEQVECILIHELGHVRRWDYLLNIVQSMAEIVLFYHPATWWVSRLIRQERENCCDELVVNLKSNKLQYAKALLNLELMRQQSPALAMSSQGGDLHSRIRRITGGEMPPKRKFHARGLLFGLLTMLCIVLLATQSHTVVKAALPFFVDQVDPQDPNFSTKSAQLLPTDVATTAHTGSAVSTGTLFNSLQMAAILGNMHVSTELQDSPITKVSINNNGEEIELRYNGSGQIVSGTRNGAAIPANELADYQAMTNNFFRGPNPPPVPPMNAMPPMGPMAPMPAMPGMPAFPPMPAMPPLGGMDPNDPNHKSFERKMEAYGKEMEKWGQEYAKRFEGKDWENYGKEMGKWGEQFAQQFESSSWAEMAQDLAKSMENVPNAMNSEEFKAKQNELEGLQTKLESAKSKREREALEAEIEKVEADMEEIVGNSVETNMADFEQRMEDWGARFGEAMGRMGDQMAEEADRMAEDADRAAEQADREAEEADRAAEQADRDAEEADREAEEADREAEEADREAERAELATDAIADALMDDGLIKSTNSYKIKLNDEEFYVNGKKLSNEMHRKYRRIVGDALGVKVGHDWVTIQHNRK